MPEINEINFVPRLLEKLKLLFKKATASFRMLLYGKVIIAH